MDKQFYVYILASQRNGTLYTGVTSNLTGRISIHRQDLLAGFTRRYGVHQLVWFEWCASAAIAIRREKQIKKWRRAWKLELIETTNPEWEDLYPRLFQ